MSQPACRLYLISPPALLNLNIFAERLSNAFSGGDIGAFQLRLKDAHAEEVLTAARTLRPIAHAHGGAFILNDRPDLALQCGADGVHLGQDDLPAWPIAKARTLLGEEAIIGVSAHASRHLAMEAGEQGADYVAFGAFFPTKSKPPAKIERWGTPTPEIIAWWSTYTVLPCAAIGGMTPANCAPLLEAGADFIAAITYVWEHAEGPGAAVREFNTAFKQAIKGK